MKSALLLAALCTTSMLAADPAPAAKALNQFGLELHQRLAAKAPKDNLCISPYSIQSALTMTYAGADGLTAEEMAKVLHLSGTEKIHEGFAALQTALEKAAERSVAVVKESSHGGPSEPISLAVANKLFGQDGYEFRQPFLKLLSETYNAPLGLMAFTEKPKKMRNDINAWVEKQTHNHIRDLLPPTAITPATRLVLVNAIYLKASWANPFEESATFPSPFHPASGAEHEVPTMRLRATLGFAKADGYRAIALPYVGDDLQFLILLPNDGLASLEKTLTAETLTKYAHLPKQEIQLFLPKFKLELPSLELGAELQQMGMKSAFDVPAGFANFDRMAPRRANDYLKINEVFHKTFLDVTEGGTKAAAATADEPSGLGGPPPAPWVIVDHSFLFAIQHRASGACLFLGRVTNP